MSTELPPSQSTGKAESVRTLDGVHDMKIKQMHDYIINLLLKNNESSFLHYLLSRNIVLTRGDDMMQEGIDKLSFLEEILVYKLFSDIFPQYGEYGAADPDKETLESLSKANLSQISSVVPAACSLVHGLSFNVTEIHDADKCKDVILQERIQSYNEFGKIVPEILARQYTSRLREECPVAPNDYTEGLKRSTRKAIWLTLSHPGRQEKWTHTQLARKNLLFASPTDEKDIKPINRLHLLRQMLLEKIGYDYANISQVPQPLESDENFVDSIVRSARLILSFLPQEKMVLRPQEGREVLNSEDTVQIAADYKEYIEGLNYTVGRIYDKLFNSQ